jgi:hypothetical protein
MERKPEQDETVFVLVGGHDSLDDRALVKGSTLNVSGTEDEYTFSILHEES